jgi:hypothetical protein
MSAKFKNPRASHNFQGRPCSITGVGSYVPERILTNAELEKMVETSDEWITSRTGIKERRIAAANEFTSDLATKAAERAMKMAGVTAEQIDLIIVATLTPDMPFPSTACLVQRKLGAARAAAFDMEAACSGFIYALEIGQQFILSRTYETVLVVGAEKLSSIVNWKDRNTCVLFGDGAGAAILQHRENSHGLLTAVMGADGNKADLLSMPGGGSACPATPESVANGMHYHGFRRQRGDAPLRGGHHQNQVRHPASGQPANRGRRRRTPQDHAGAAVHQPPQIRQHLRCLCGDCAGRGGEFRENFAWRPDSARRLWCRFNLGRGGDRVVG